MTPRPILDHIVLLVPHSTLLNLPNWLTTAFTILPGGRHADGATENKLILFADGVYLELIAFIQPNSHPNHRWAHRPQGHIIDWAITTTSTDHFDPIVKRVHAAHTGIKYTQPPTPGGRVRPDGVRVEWAISTPFLEQDDEEDACFVNGGQVPFWCLDRTPRALRVPCEVRGNVEHACGATGVARVAISVRGGDDMFWRLKRMYDALLDEQGRQVDCGGDDVKTVFGWPINTPQDGVVGGQKKSGCMLCLALMNDSDEVQTGAPGVSVQLTLVSETGGEAIAGTLGDEKWQVQFDFVEG